MHTLFNVIGTVIFETLTWAGYQIHQPHHARDVFSGVLTSAISPHIANAHTFFNIFNTMLLLPFTGLLAKIASMLIPKDPEDMVSWATQHLNYHLVADSHRHRPIFEGSTRNAAPGAHGSLCFLRSFPG